MKSFFLLIFCCLTGSCSCFCRRYIEQYVFAHIDKNPKIIERYLWIAAESSPEAAYILGLLYIDGNFFEKNLKLAKNFLRRSLSLQYLPAYQAVGDGYYSGDTEERDIKMAFQTYEAGAKRGYGPCQFNAGLLLFKHRELWQNRKKALKQALSWLQLAEKNEKDLAKEIRISAARLIALAQNELKLTK
jgi:TPR repeat protein